MADQPHDLIEYEATLERARTPQVSETETPLELFRPFGPLIARLKAPEDVVETLNAFVDEFVARHGDPATGEGRDITVGTFRVPPPAMAGAPYAFFEQVILDYVRQCEAPARELEFESFWVVRQGAGTFSPVHFHSSDVAGVVYLKVPPAITDATAPGNYITARRGGCITFLHGGRQALAKNYVSFTPAVGDVLLSPAWLLHAVEPFDGPGERRSMAFNARVR